MAEEKILIPAYKRTDACARCGADVYSPELESRGGWPLMSACTCIEGPQIKSRERAEGLRQSRKVKPEERAQAA